MHISRLFKLSFIIILIYKKNVLSDVNCYVHMNMNQL